MSFLAFSTASSLACCFCFSRSYSRDFSTFIATSRLRIWLRSFWQETTRPVGRWVMRTAESVTFTCCPPAPLER